VVRSKKRIVLFAGPGEFAQRVVECLVARSIGFDALVWGGYRGYESADSFPLCFPRRRQDHGSLPYIANDRHTTIIYWQSDADPLARLTAIRPDIGLVVCFPERLGCATWTIPALGCFNLHPSLLPAYRGPDPLFWQFYYGERAGGVTLHCVSKELDAGPIVLQQPVPFTAGLTRQAAQRLVAEAGAVGFANLLSQLEVGSFRSVSQDESAASYFPTPRRKHLAITTGWSAERAYRFIRGVSATCGPLPIYAGKLCIQANDAVAMETGTVQEQPVVVDGASLCIQFRTGIVQVRGAIASRVSSH